MSILIVLGLMLLVLTGVSIVHYLQSRGHHINRWFFGFGAFLIVLIPSFVFPGLPKSLLWVTYILSALLTIMFFETSRDMIQHYRIRGMVKPEHFESKGSHK